ncbi:hypothetical protein FQZ97_845600 [compost metagenome]
MNHQSQLRVPPTPRMAPLPICAARGKFSPELISAVVLPEPGGPMMTYQGSSYRLRRSPPPSLARLSSASASSMRCLSVANSSAVATVAASGATATSPCMAFAALRRAWTMRNTRKPIHSANTIAISTQRVVGEARGSCSPKAISGPRNQMIRPRAIRPSTGTTQRTKKSKKAFTGRPPREG